MHTDLQVQCIYFLFDFNQNRDVSINFVNILIFQENMFDGGLAADVRTDRHDEADTQ